MNYFMKKINAVSAQHLEALFKRCSPSDFKTTADLTTMKGMSVRCTMNVGPSKADTFIAGGSKSFKWEVAECIDAKDIKCIEIVKGTGHNCSTQLECQNYILGLHPQASKVDVSLFVVCFAKFLSGNILACSSF